MHPTETDTEVLAWYNAADEDLWLFDKLIVSRRLGYNCGPVGTMVPHPGRYIVRPCVNTPGMSRGAKITFIELDTLDHPDCHPGFFWCEVFKGRHISVDYLDGQQILAVEGFREKNDPLYRFSKWQKIDDIIPMPKLLSNLKGKYNKINVEYIDGKPIEFHLRHNPDFIHDNTVAYPVWKNETPISSLYTNTNIPNETTEKLKYIESPDYLRRGFWID